MSAETPASDTTPTATPSTRAAPGITVDGLLITAVPGMLTTIVLDVVKALSGLGKIAVATALAVVLWWVVEGRKRHSRHLGTALSRHWKWALLGLAALAVLALVVTNLTYGVPTPSTIAVSSVAMAILVAQAYLGRRLEPVAAATAAAIAGAAIGLCVVIAL
jgi:hypothetical protein